MSETTYRLYDEERDRAAFVRAMSLAFGGSTEDAQAWTAEIPAAMLRTVEQGGAFAGGLALYPFGHWFGGRSVPAVGVAGVGVLPEARGRGAATALMHAAVREMHEQGVALSTLYPAVKPLYRRAGYEEAGVKCVVEADLPRLRGGDRAAALRAATDADRPAIEALERSRARLHDGNVDRSPHMWRRVRASRRLDTHAQVVEEGGVPTGYVQYRMVRSDDGGLLPCQDMVATTPSAARRLLAFLADHAMQFAKARWLGHPADDLLVATSALACTVKVSATWMARITHVQAALASRGYAAARQGEVVLDVVDDVCPANAGRWTLHVADGIAQVGRGGSGGVRLDIRALAALYTGFTPARVLERQGRIEGDARSIATLDGLFGGPLPWMQDEF